MIVKSIQTKVNIPLIRTNISYLIRYTQNKKYRSLNVIKHLFLF